MKYKEDIEISKSEHNIHVKNSCRITDYDDILEVCETLKYMYPYYKRTTHSMFREWVAHNWLYYHNIQSLRTKSVDLEEPINIFREIGYLIIYIISYL